MKKIFLLFTFVLIISTSIHSQEVTSARLYGMGIGSAYLIKDFETDVLKFPVLANNIEKRYCTLLVNPIKLNYNRFTYFEKRNKTIYGIHLGLEDGFGWNENLNKKKSYIQIILGNSKNVFGYKLINSVIKNHLAYSFESVSGRSESIRTCDSKDTERSIKHLLTYSTIKEHSIDNDILLNFSIGYNDNNTIFDDNLYKSYDTLYDSLDTYHNFVYYNDFENIIYYEYDVSKKGSNKCSEFTINFSAQIEQMFLEKFPTKLYGEIGLKHSNLRTVSGNFIANEFIRCLAENNSNEPDTIVTYTGIEIYDLVKNKGNELIVVIGSGTLYQLSKKLKLFISGKSIFNYEIIDETFNNELNGEVLNVENTVFRYEGYTNFGTEYVTSNNFTLRIGSSWIFAGTRRKNYYLNYQGIDFRFTPELRLKILAGISYSYSDNLNFDMAVNISNRSEELFISTIYNF